MKQVSKIPGLVRKTNANGEVRLYWEANKRARALNYAPSSIRVVAQTEEELASICAIHQAEMLEWIARQEGDYEHLSEITISKLFREYRLRPESPFNCRVKPNTRRTYSHSLDWVEERIGTVKIDAINLAVIRRWYNEARFPDGPTGAEHIHTAYRVVEMLRRVFSFGVAAEVDGCARVHAILHNTQFERPRPRQSAMTRDQAQTFIKAALANGRRSLALATAIQFECAMRQKDVIGEWLPIPASGARSNYTLNNQQWVNGITWADISDEWQFYKRTTKTGQEVAHDLTLCPMVMEIITSINEAERIGPLIIDEKADRPYADRCYSPAWRQIADLAGLPRDVWSMDARAGAATEAATAGSTLDDIRETLGHSDSKTTMRYMRGKKLEQSRRVAQLRLALK
jgi:integrase